MFVQELSFMLLCSVYLVQSATYDGYKIYDIYAKTIAERETLWGFYREPEYDFFSLPHALDEPTRVMVHPDVQANFEAKLSQLGANFSLITDDVGHTVREEPMQTLLERLMYERQSSEASDFSFRLDDINAYLNKLVIDHPRRVLVKTAGRSYEGRDMNVIIITNGDGRYNKNVIFIDAGIHAREWIAPTTAMYIIYQLVENFEENSDLLKDYDWIILPVVNPDGYEYSHTNERLWRKTRKPVSSSSCFGADLNRNFDFEWGGLGTTDVACAPTFRGTEPSSEPETRVVRSIMHSLTGKAKFYLSLHAYGRLLLYPWGYNYDIPSNYEDIDRVAQAGAAAIEAATGSKYKVGTSANVLFPIAGASDDYALHVGIPISITMELPPGNSSYGFAVPADLIKPIVEESWIGIKAMAEVVISDLYKS